MDIRPILKQVVDKNTRQGSILSVIIMNTFQYYNSPIIALPINPDSQIEESGVQQKGQDYKIQNLGNSPYNRGL